MVRTNQGPRPIHWAFVAPRRPPLPEKTKPLTRSELEPSPARNHQAFHPIDALVLERLKHEGVKPAREADRATLLRRLALDLTGLPPAPAEIEGFLRDTGTDAYDKLVERLLSSPHFGERWGRHWLDVSRYADSNGYSIDAPRSIWPYRDWVIQAMNRDLPFDQFTVWQLAGDLVDTNSLPAGTYPFEPLIATGFHRNTQINQEGGIDPEQFRVESVLDRVNTTATAWLGITLACAQCHDHKYDPFTQRDYYRFFAFFNSTIDDGHGKSRPEGTLELPNRPGHPAHPTTTLVLRELPAPRETRVFVKGDFTRPAERVTPGLPAALSGSLPDTSSITPGGGDPARQLTRLDLARWLVGPNQPLTARVIVNRLWQEYFGRGLVETENDFGSQGTPPSHPQLLDWLACELMNPTTPAAGEAKTNLVPWSLKHLHRLIVTSATYRQSSRQRPELTSIDPANRLLARQRRLRLDAEIVRDVALAASGLLDQTVGGPSVFPPQPDGVMNLGQSHREWKASTGPDRHRRGLYTFFWRATPYPSLTVFDAADGFSSCTRRLRSNTPLQALTLLNDEAFHECARALAARLLREEPRDETRRLELAFRLCLSRQPDRAERRRLLTLLREEGKTGSASDAWTAIARVVLNLDETITRE